jgi:hypothetical protein
MGGGETMVTIDALRGAKALDIIRLESFGAQFSPVQWANGSLHVASVRFDLGGTYHPSSELAWTSFSNVAALTRAVIAELEARE